MALPLLAALGMHVGSAILGSRASGNRQARQQGTANETARRQAQVAGKLQGDAIGDSLAGLGFDASNVNALQDIARGMALGEPTANVALQAMINEQQIGMDPQQQQQNAANIALTETQNQALQQGMAYDAELQPGRVAAQDMENQLRAMGLDPVPPTLPTNIDAISPFTGMPIKPAIAGQEYDKQQTDADRLVSVVGRTAELQGLIDEYGSEMVGPVSRQMTQLRDSLIFDAVALKGGGAPQAAELEALGRGLPDPTSLGANVVGAGQSFIPGGRALLQYQKDGMQAGWSQFKYEASKQLLDMLEKNPALRVDIDTLDPRVFEEYAARFGARVEDVRDYFRNNSGVSFIAQ